ncbi:MAG: MmcQ/YjbR family DNA-binding protein [Candidatus Saccharimonadales bacterium]
MLSEKSILDFIAQFDGESTTEKGLNIFKTNDRIFLIIHEGTNPLRIDVKCDYKLARFLSERYETVQKSTLLGNKGIEVILTGQLPDDDVKDLIAYSFHHAKVI